MEKDKKEMDLLLEKHGKVFPAGTVIFKEGDRGEFMYFIHEGEIEITKRTGRKEKTIAVLTKGEFFGEIAMLTGRPRSASAIARTDSILIEINREKFESVVSREPSLAIKILQRMAERLWRTDQILENLLLSDREGQVINMLLQMADEGGKVVLDLDELETRVAADANLIKAILFRLHTLGYIFIKQKTIELKDRKKLEQLRDFYQWKDSLAESLKIRREG